MRKWFLQIINHVRMTGGETFAGRTAVKITLAAMARQLFNCGKVDGRISITSAHHKAHGMAFFCQLSVENFDIRFKCFVCVAFHGLQYHRIIFLSTANLFFRRVK